MKDDRPTVRPPHAVLDGNHLWTLLPAPVRERLNRHAKMVSLKVGQIVFRAFERPPVVYFPEAAVIARLTHLTDGHTLAAGLIGRDGMAGIGVLPGAFMAYDGVVQIPGTARRIDADVMARELRHSGPFHGLLGRYAYLLFINSIQAAACNNFHSVKRRCALLVADDARSRRRQ